MAHNNDNLGLYATLGFGAGIYMFFKGFREFRKYRVVADTPEIPIRSIPMGLVDIYGTARATETLTSPLTHTPCCLFMVNVEEWHREPRGGGEWKHVATDIQSVKFYLEDATGKVLVDPTGAELDLPQSARREVRSSAAQSSGASSGAAPAPGSAATDTELLKYVSVARVRGFGKTVGKAVSLLTHGDDPERQNKQASLLNFLANPTSATGEGFAMQIMRASIARKDPSGETARAALEVWKHPQGSPESDAALQRAAQVYARVMASSGQPIPPGAIPAEISQHREQALGLAAMLAGSLEPQSDPEAEKARQAALAYGRGELRTMVDQGTGPASGHYRLSEFCLVPGASYNLTGTCTENPSPRDEHDRNLIVKGRNEATFLISSKTEKGVESSLKMRALKLIFGGAALAIVCLAILLAKLGLLF